MKGAGKMSNGVVNPDQVNRQKQMLENAAQMNLKKNGTKLNYEGRKNGSRRQLITTIVVVAAIVAALVLLSILGNS